MRKGLLIVGSLIIVFALAVLVNGYLRLEALATCQQFGPCPVGVYPTYNGIAFLENVALTQVIYGVVFSLISGVLILFGIFGSRSRHSEDLGSTGDLE